jgi:hypothetical protein
VQNDVFVVHNVGAPLVSVGVVVFEGGVVQDIRVGRDDLSSFDDEQLLDVEERLFFSLQLDDEGLFDVAEILFFSRALGDGGLLGDADLFVSGYYDGIFAVMRPVDVDSLVNHTGYSQTLYRAQ